MIIKYKNQNDIINSELINLYEIDYIFSNKPINRYKNKPILEKIKSELENLKKKIKNIANCSLKDNAKQMVFGDGNKGSH